MDDITLLLSILITGFAGLVLIVSIASYLKIKALKLLMISIAFFAFLIKGLMLTTEIITQSEMGFIFDFIALLLFYFASVKK